MKITYLGHAGFCVETEHAIVITDAWLSPTGAFDSSWFQLPANHHLAPFVDEKLGTPGKEKFVYVSHEHEDHYDIGFLRSLKNRDFTFVIPKYRRPQLRRELADYECKQLLAINDGESVPFEGGELKLFLDDSELNRDSAIFIRAEGKTFLNLNDCRIFDRLRSIGEQEGKIDVFTCQFSGASWHPTCYEYDPEQFDAISVRKVTNKFEMTRRALEQLQPTYFIPSAGPVCFIAPELLAVNFTHSGIFLRYPELNKYLESLGTWTQTGTQAKELMPGDSMEVATGERTLLPGERYSDEDFEQYVRAYAKRYEPYFEERDRQHKLVNAQETLERLKSELEQKLQLLTLRERVTVPLYYGLEELPGKWLRVDFKTGVIEYADTIAEEHYYRIVAYAWQIAKVLDKQLSWENFALSFRVRLKRIPDSYQALIHAFITLDRGQLYSFCRMILELESRDERIEVTVGGRTFSVNRWCPHNGGDLAEGWVEDGHYLVCPRHRWCFDLKKGGACTTNDTSVDAQECAAEAIAS